jgi:hypothetical protein
MLFLMFFIIVKPKKERKTPRSGKKKKNFHTPSETR